MKSILNDVLRKDKKRFLSILFLHIAVGIMGSISIVMLVPMLELLNISVEGGAWAWFLVPFTRLPIEMRALLIIFLFVGITVVRAFLQRISKIKENEFIVDFELNLRRDVYDSVFMADYEAISDMKSSTLVNLIVTQCHRSRLCLQRMVGLFSSFASAAMQLVIALFISPPVTLLVLVVGTGFLWLLRPFQKKSRECGEESIAAHREMYREINNQLGGIKEIRAYGVEKEHFERFDKVTRTAGDISKRITQLNVFPQFCYSVAVAVMLAIAFVVSVMVLKMGSGQLVMLVYIFSRLWPVFSSWQGQLQDIQSNSPSWDKIQSTIKEFNETVREKAISNTEPLGFTKEINFDKVSFSYQGHDAVVLRDSTFTLPFGTMTALVGLSGAGKSTTADLLMGLLRPHSGHILIDGVELTEDRINMWRRSVGYIPQDPFVFSGTLRENLARFHPNATDEEMIAALKKSMAWKFIEKWETGLDTVIGEKGIGLSGGERQRVVLARVLLGSPSLIILDEATSALDYESETAIRETLLSLRKKTTILVIAHRLSTIKGADRAIVLEDGRVSQCDDVETLLSREDGYLKRMLLAE